jgi:hypothetical protein
VNPGPTNVTFVTIRFLCLVLLLPVLRTRNISSSAIGRTCSTHPTHFSDILYIHAFSYKICKFLRRYSAMRIVYSQQPPDGYCPDQASTNIIIETGLQKM